MRRSRTIRTDRIWIAAVFVLLLSTGAACAHESPSGKVSLEPLVSGLSQPIFLTHAGDRTGRLFVIEKEGRIRVVAGGKLTPKPFLDITGLTSKGGEQGLLGLAFHPQFAANGRAFVNYTDVKGNTVIAEYRLRAGAANELDPDAAKIVLTFDQPYANHNGGNLSFGPDGMLYIGTGDGGSGGDPHGNGQNLGVLLGKMLRIDVNSEAAPYAVPPDNPFVGRDGVRPEIWAYGLRNPWRYSFDSRTGRLIAGDVGQNAYEEVDIIKRAGNYGWNTMEGTHCFKPENCSRAGLELPIADYGRSDGVCVTGGYVYRGKQMPELDGQYLFGDFGSGALWSLTERSDGTWTRTLLIEKAGMISSFGTDEDGEVYLVDFGGTINKIVRGKL